MAALSTYAQRRSGSSNSDSGTHSHASSAQVLLYAFAAFSLIFVVALSIILAQYAWPRSRPYFACVRYFTRHQKRLATRKSKPEFQATSEHSLSTSYTRQPLVLMQETIGIPAIPQAIASPRMHRLSPMPIGSLPSPLVELSTPQDVDFMSSPSSSLFPARDVNDGVEALASPPHSRLQSTSDHSHISSHTSLYAPSFLKQNPIDSLSPRQRSHSRTQSRTYVRPVRIPRRSEDGGLRLAGGPPGQENYDADELDYLWSRRQMEEEEVGGDQNRRRREHDTASVDTAGAAPPPSYRSGSMRRLEQRGGRSRTTSSWGARSETSTSTDWRSMGTLPPEYGQYSPVQRSGCRLMVLES